MSVPSVAAQVVVSVIPIVGIVMGSVVVFFYLLWNHKEKMLLIQSGAFEPSHLDLDTFCLLAGLLLVGVGGALLVLLILMDGLAYSLLGGLIPLALGAGLLLFYGIRSRRSAS